MNDKKRDRNHPVWDVYDLYRTARLNVKYYSAKLSRLQRNNLIIEVVLAATVPSSAIALIWFWDTPVGKDVWQWLIAFSAVLALVKPFLKLTERIRRHEEILTGYHILENDLQKIKVLISQDRRYDERHRTRFEEALDRKGQLELKSPEAKIDERLRKEAGQQVQRELPGESFYIPEEV